MVGAGTTTSPNFYPRSPCGERPLNFSRRRVKAVYFYPRSPCGERRLPICKYGDPLIISIHALLAESDPQSAKILCNLLIFLSTLSLRRATRRLWLLAQTASFLSTLSLRRATVNGQRCDPACIHFYPRSPCGERHYDRNTHHDRFQISIHALLAESDLGQSITLRLVTLFLSTLSLRRATVGAIGQLQCIPDFYPRSPCGERR